MWSGIITWLLGLIVALVAVSKSPWALAALTGGRIDGVGGMGRV